MVTMVILWYGMELRILCDYIVLLKWITGSVFIESVQNIGMDSVRGGRMKY